MRKLIVGLSFVITASGVHVAWAQGPEIIDPVRPVAANVYLCRLNPGKTMADVDAVQQMWLNAAEEPQHNSITLRLTPRYVSGPDPFDGIWLDYLPFEQLAQSSEWWDDNGQEVIAAIFEAVSCQESLNTNRLRYVNRGSNDALPEDGTGFFLWDWCSPREGVTGAAVESRRQADLERVREAGARVAWSVMYPFLGTRADTRLGQFANMVVLPDWAALASLHEYEATGGWRLTANYNETVAQCTGPNIYDLTVLNLPHTPWGE